MALWSLVASGDADAFEELYERHADAVYNHCFRATSSWSIAEEVTNIVFMEAWRRRTSVDMTRDTVRPWLLGVANNVLRNASRARRRYAEALRRFPPPFAATDFGDDVARRLDDERAMVRIRDAMGSLRPEERKVVELCDWDGLSQAEAAMTLGVPAGTVRSRLARAHTHMRSRLSSVGR